MSVTADRLRLDAHASCRHTAGLRGFVVVDLASQGQAVRDLTRGWPDDAVLGWLRRWGTVRILPFTQPGIPVRYSFVSPASRATVFSFHGDELNIHVPNRQTFR